MDTGAIIGIVVGSIVLITLLFCLLAQTTGGGETKIVETPMSLMLTWVRFLDIPNILLLLQCLHIRGHCRLQFILLRQSLRVGILNRRLWHIKWVVRWKEGCRCIGKFKYTFQYKQQYMMVLCVHSS